MRFFLCKPNSDEVITSGDIETVLKVSLNQKLNGELCGQLLDPTGKDYPGMMVGIIDNGKPYWLPFAGNIVPQA